MKEKGRVYPLEVNGTREVRKKYRSVRTEGRRKLKSTWSEEITQRQSLRSQPASKLEFPNGNKESQTYRVKEALEPVRESKRAKTRSSKA